MNTYPSTIAVYFSSNRFSFAFFCHGKGSLQQNINTDHDVYQFLLLKNIKENKFIAMI